MALSAVAQTAHPEGYTLISKYISSLGTFSHEFFA